MRAVFPGGEAVALSLTFDDARASQLDCARRLDDHGIRATFYVLPSGVEAAPEAWRAVASNGHEIGNHSSTHPCSANFGFSRANALEDKTLPEIAVDLADASRRIEAALDVRTRTFAYPCGQAFVGRGSRRQSYVPLVAERFVAGRGYGSETANAVDVCDVAHLDAHAIDGLDANGLWALVEAGMSPGTWVVLVGHDVGGSGTQTVRARELDRFCARAVGDDRIWIAPVLDVAQQVRAVRPDASQR